MTVATNTLARAALTLLAAGGVISTLVWAGPLNPPSGAVSSTYKTLTEVEPRIAINSTNTPGDADSLFKITQPGSYYLTGNITGVIGKHGIEIAASGVSIDLNGFSLVGVASMGAFDGIYASVFGLTNLAVVNGSIRNWGQDGIDFFSQTAYACRIESVVATGNAEIGFSVHSRSVISHCTSNGGTKCIYAISACAIHDCAVSAASQQGMLIQHGCVVTSSVANGNADGFNVNGGTTVTDCAAYQNTGIGFMANDGTEIVHCTSSSNNLDGIKCASGCTIVGNACSSNGIGGANEGAGIHATGFDNRIESNHCLSADRGIDVDIGGNFISKNTCSGNTTNWDVAAGNTILVVQGSSAGAVLGNAGGTAPGSTDPNANFTY